MAPAPLHGRSPRATGGVRCEYPVAAQELGDDCGRSAREDQID